MHSPPQFSSKSQTEKPSTMPILIPVRPEGKHELSFKPPRQTSDMITRYQSPKNRPGGSAKGQPRSQSFVAVRQPMTKAWVRNVLTQSPRSEATPRRSVGKKVQRSIEAGLSKLKNALRSRCRLEARAPYLPSKIRMSRLHSHFDFLRD